LAIHIRTLGCQREAVDEGVGGALVRVSVTDIVQRAVSLVGLCYPLTLYCLLRGATGARGTAWYAAGVETCAMGMASREVMVTAPVVAFLFDRTFIAGSFKKGLRLRWR